MHDLAGADLFGQHPLCTFGILGTPPGRELVRMQGRSWSLTFARSARSSVKTSHKQPEASDPVEAAGMPDASLSQ